MDSNALERFAKIRLCGYEGPEKEEFMAHVKNFGKEYSWCKRGEYNQMYLMKNPSSLGSLSSLPSIKITKTANGKYLIVTTYFHYGVNVELILPEMLQYYKHSGETPCYEKLILERCPDAYAKKYGVTFDECAFKVAKNGIKNTYDIFFFGNYLVLRGCDLVLCECDYMFKQTGILLYEKCKLVIKREECERLKLELAIKNADIELLKAERDHALAYGGIVG